MTTYHYCVVTNVSDYGNSGEEISGRLILVPTLELIRSRPEALVVAEIDYDHGQGRWMVTTHHSGAPLCVAELVHHLRKQGYWPDDE